ncbi:glucose PTS transporter subunit IIA [uncultured Anaerococcus sp.]|uniref:PTS transporter subunit IIABC n=1 Tax=uncultured Anaerococcus sp. TaxID=293428 RepID=UPI00280ACDB4|nr:glucose PTS transporter subunit IIA [uncultured Anaerococcus sp.]MDU5150022.1 glucose PTS transporter subunit IIA [Anaerococcus prevotii]
MSKAKSKQEIREKTGENKVFGTLQKLGQTFMLPISLLPIAGLLLGIGSSFTNPSVIEMYNLGNVLYEGGTLYGILSVLASAGNIVFSHLGLLFGISVASGLAKREKGVAALSAIIGYFVMYASMTAALNQFRDIESLKQTQGLITSYLGFDNTMNLGVMGGIILGLVVANLHNKYNMIELPEAISFFAGTHFIPIISSLAGIVIGIIMTFVWPLISAGFSSIGQVISGMGIFGIFLYVYIYRALIPFGLHHVFYLPFWQTAIGGTAVVNGQTVVGAQNIVFAQLAAGVPIDAHAAAHFSYMFPVMLFGIPAACKAMYESCDPSRKKDMKGFYTSSALTSFMTGITEPIEFPMLFASPVLYYGVHCVLFGISGVLAYLLGSGVALTFSGGVIDFILYGVLPGNAITRWVPLLIMGLVFGVVYYFIFKFGIKKFNWNVPGRDAIAADDDKISQNADYSKLNDKEKRAYKIVAGLGGSDNLDDVTNCATRLRVKVKDGSKVDKDLLSTTGSSGTVVQGNNVQVVYGTTVPNVKASVEDLIDRGLAPKAADLSDKEVASNDKPKAEEEKPTTKVKENNTAEGKIKTYAPADGRVVELEEVSDPVFSGKLMGDGYALRPTSNDIYAPVAGEVVMVANTNHAIGIKTEEGLEILVHMGIDTVALEGQGFDISVKEGDKVTKDSHIAVMDLDYIKENGKQTDIMVIVTNSENIEGILLNETRDVKAGEEVGEIEIK